MRKHHGLKFPAVLAILYFFSSTAALSAAMPVTGQIDSITPVSDDEYELAVQTPDGQINRFLVITTTLVQTSVPAASLQTGYEIIPPITKKAAPGTKTPSSLEMIKKPEFPEKPEIPQIPKIPQVPKPIEMPAMPEKPEIPEVPQIPGMKQMPPQESQGTPETPPSGPADAQPMPPVGSAPEESPAGKKKEAPADGMPPPDPFMSEPKLLEKATPEDTPSQEKISPPKKTPLPSPRPFKKVLGVTKTENAVNIEIENGGKKEALTLALKENVLASLRLEELQEEMTVTVDFVEEEDHEVAKVITVVPN